MKTPIANPLRRLLLLACAGLGTSLVAQAQSAARPQPVCIDQVGPFSYLVRVSNPAQVRSEVQIINLRNKAVLYQQFSRYHTFGKCLNVEGLPDGQYAFLVKVGAKAYNYTLDIHSNYDRTARLGSVSTVAMAK